MKTSEFNQENPFLGKSTFHQDYHIKFIISLANSDILKYDEKRKWKKSFKKDVAKVMYS